MNDSIIGDVSDSEPSKPKLLNDAFFDVVNIVAAPSSDGVAVGEIASVEVYIEGDFNDEFGGAVFL